MPNIDDDIYTPAQAVGAANDNPDKAAQAVGLSAATGAPAPTIYDDLDGFKTAVKQQTAAALVTGNPQLAKFTNNPMAARVSNDDLDKLDAVSGTLTKAAQPGIWDRLKAAAAGSQDDQDLMASIKEGFDYQGQRQEFNDLYNYIDSPAWRGLVGFTAPATVGANAALHGFQAGLSGGGELLRQMYGELGGQRVYEGIEQALTGRTTGFGSPEELSRDAQVMAQVAFAPESHLPPELNDIAKQAQRSANVAKPFLDAGQSPPTGIDPHIDAAHVAQAQADLVNLKEALAQSQESMTRGRAPSMYSEFVRQHVGDATIGINPQAIREMYGSEVPHFEDGKLGWVQDLPAQLLRSAVTGEDVHVPVPDYLSKVDPAIHDALEPNIRARPGGVTQLEAEALAQKAATVDMYHATDSEYDELDPNASSRMAARSPFEEGTVFFGDSPEAVSGYGQRVLKAKIDLGNTATYDVRDLYNNDPSFIEKIVQAQHEENPGKEALAEQTVRDRYKQYQENKKYKYDAITREYNNMTPEDRALFEMPPIESLLVPDKIGNATGARQAVMREARARGLDTVRIEGLTEGNQLAVLNPDKIQRLTEGDRVVGVVRRQAGLADASARVSESATGPMRQYPVPVDGSVEWRRSTPEGDEILVKREGGKDTYYNVGEAEGTARVIDDLRKIAGPLPPLEQAAAEVAPHVLDHLGISDVPTYTVPGDHPAVKGALGMYYRNSDAIVLRHSASERQMLNTMVHESYHAAFSRGIDIVPGAKDAIQHLIDIGREAEAVEFGKPRPQVDPSAPRGWGHALAEGEAHFNYPGGSTNYYGFTNPHEFVSEAFSRENFQNFMSKVTLTPEQTARFHELLGDETSKIKNLWDAFLQLARKTFGLGDKPRTMTMLDAAFRVGDRLTAAAEAERPQMAEGDFTQHALPQAPDPAFDHAAALGMTKGQLARYRELITKQRGEEADAHNAEILAAERKRQGAEWKKNEVEMRKNVSAELSKRPDVLADSILRSGTKLDTDALTPEQHTALGDAHTRGGVDPDALAHQLGYETGDQMIREVAALREARGTRPTTEFFRSMVQDETAKRMEERYGNLDKNVVDAAKERVLSDTQMDILHNDADAAAGGKVPVSKAEIKQNVENAVGEMKLGQVRSADAITAAGRAAAQIEDALLKGDAQAAFTARMAQYNHLLAAKEMLRIEKAKTAFAKTAKRYASRSVDGASQEYVDFIHDMLTRVGQPVKRSLADLTDAVEKSGYRNLAEFVDSKQGALRDLHVPDFILDDKFNSKLDDLTAAQFEQVHDGLKAMVFNARDELKVTRAGEKADLAETLAEMREKLESLGPPKKYDWSPNKFSVANTAKAYWWSSINLETMLNRFDRGDPRGVFNQTLVRQYTEAANYKERVLKQYSEKLRAFGEIKDFNKAVQNDLFIDQITSEKLPMSRKNLLGVLQNIGNAENLKKLAGGYNLDPKAVVDWVMRNTTKEDWDRAQGIGDLFAELHNHADNMSREVSGVGIDKIDLQPIQTPHGEYAGWYNPIQYDALRPGKSKTLLGPDALERDGYFRATTPKGYTKSRTQYIAPMQLDLNIVPMRMHQMIHDITMRPTILQLSKFFYDSKFKQDMIRHYGDHQAEQLIPFLRDVANSPNFRSQAEMIGNSFMSRMASNTVGTLIGMNPSTVMKHGPTAAIKSIVQTGPVNFAREFVGLLKSDPETSRSNWSTAMEKSDELARRMTNFKELLAQHGQEISLDTSSPGSKFRDVRSVAQYIGTLPVAVSDILSAVPTWLASYKEAIANGEDEGMAKFLADRDVRAAHGSSIITNKPQIARSKNPIAQSFATLYGFFSENLQKQYEVAWRAKDALGMASEGDYKTAMAQVPKIAGLVFTSTIIPALIEEAVTPATNEKHESWGHYAFSTMLLGTFSSLLGFRDVAHAIASNRDPGGGLFSTTMKGVTDPARDVKDLVEGKHMTDTRAAVMIKHAFTLTGLATGLTNAQEGKTAQFLYRYFHNLEHPHSVWQAVVGARYGTLKGHQ